MSVLANVTSSADFFEAKYRKQADPWSFASSEYELRRYSAVAAALSHRRYKRGFEPGCSIGVLTERLSELCDAVYAFDFSETGAAQAKDRCADLTNVEVARAELNEAVSAELTGFDLVVMSEIGYYFEVDVWERISAGLIENMPQGGTLLAAHWLGHSADHRISGDAVHQVVLANPKLRLEHSERETMLRLDRLVRI